MSCVKNLCILLFSPFPDVRPLFCRPKRSYKYVDLTWTASTLKRRLEGWQQNGTLDFRFFFFEQAFVEAELLRIEKQSKFSCFNLNGWIQKHGTGYNNTDEEMCFTLGADSSVTFRGWTPWTARSGGSLCFCKPQVVRGIDYVAFWHSYKTCQITLTYMFINSLSHWEVEGTTLSSGWV